MQFLATAKPLAQAKTPAGQNATRHTILNLYTELPSGDITLEEFERLALERLKGQATRNPNYQTSWSSNGPA